MDGILMQKNIDDANGIEANNFRKCLMGKEMFESIREMLDYLDFLQRDSESHVIIKSIIIKFKQILQDNRVGII